MYQHLVKNNIRQGNIICRIRRSLTWLPQTHSMSWGFVYVTLTALLQPAEGHHFMKRLHSTKLFVIRRYSLKENKRFEKRPKISHMTQKIVNQHIF